jgi:very-short-patch-repair endonuclease
MPTLLPKLKPCLLMSPLSVAQYLDATHKFDLVVFDEASQIPVWDAVGAIARGKQLAVAGDQMQLPPTSFFQKTYDSEDNIAEDEVQDLESVLDECLAVGLPRQRLEWHYRSRHEALIAFSNTRYYDGDLVTFPSPVTNDMSVSFRHVHGTYDRGSSKTNRAEAEAIVREIEEHYLDESRRKKSVGVVTFNQPQMSLIQSLLESRRGANPKLDAVLAEIEEEPLFVKNLENVQGDERDVILFSITYGPDAAGKITMQMGPLIKEGGHRRLNVAITRAREQVILFSTLLPEHIDTARASGQGVADLKAYLDFARRGKVALLAQSSPTGLDPDSPFEIAVINALREKGWTVHPQVGCSGYRVDIGVVSPHVPGEYLMGVECDGATYHSAATARDRDRLRQLVLERLGWSLHRIWSTDWWNDREKEIERLDRVLNERLASRARGGAEHAPLKGQAPEADDDDANTPLPPGHPQREIYARGPDANIAPTPTAQPQPVAKLPVFARHELRVTKAKRFDDRFSDGLIAEQILELVNAEGPVSEDEVFRRVARAWGIERVGNRVAERIAFLRPLALAVTKNGGRFYWPSAVNPMNWQGVRIAADQSEGSKRHIDEVAIEEIANAAAYLLDNSGSAPVSELSKDVCKLFGMARISMDAQARGKKGIQLLERQGRATIHDDRVLPAPQV